MHFEFKKTSFILANLGAFFLTAFTVWFFIMTYSITFKEDNLSFSSFFDVAFNLTFFLSPAMFLIVLIPSYILSYQYWKYSQNLELTVGDGYIEVLNNNSTEPIVIKKSDIQKIVSVQSMAKHHRLFSQFSYLVIFKEGNEIILPCFVVTQKDFFNCFGKYDNLGESYPFTPFIKPKNYVGINKIPEFSLPKLIDKPIKLSGTQFELLRLLVIAGLTFYTFTAYFVGQTWFIGSFAVTLAISFILCLHKKVLIAGNKLIIRHFNSESTFSFNEIDSLDEIQWTTVLSLGLSDAMVRMRLTDHNGIHKTVYFFPRKKGYIELKNKLGHK